MKSDTSIYMSSTAIVIASLLSITLLSGTGILAYFIRDPNCRSDVGVLLPSSSTPPPHTNQPPSVEPKAPWEEYRLPGTLEPKSYNLKIKVDLDQFVFDGNVAITFNCLVQTDIVLIHSKELDIERDSVQITRILDNQDVPLSGEPELYPDTQYLAVKLSSTLTVGQQYVISIIYRGQLQDDLIGIYRSSYTNATGVKRYLAASFFSPANARKAFPCFDEPTMKANITTTLVHRAEYSALSNMAPYTSLPSSEHSGWMETTFASTPKMSTYVVGFAVTDFEKVCHTSREKVEVCAWARSNAIDQVDYAMNIAVPILQYYEDYFDIQFPLPKIDMVATPDYGAGGMENWGLINYRESAFLYNPLVSTTLTKRRVATVVSHELAHQWFGDLATHWWWEDLWLKEGFASFMEYYGVDHVEPQWHMLDQFLILDVHPAFHLDSLLSSHPISVPVNHVDEINSIFDAISYSKGASIIRMLRYFLGHDTFRNGLQKYLNRYAYSNAKMNDLWDVLSEAVDEDGLILPASIRDIMNTWTLQMGFPVVTVSRDYSVDDVISFSCDQDHFLVDPEASPDDEYTWYVPLTFTDGSNPKYNEQDVRMIWLEKNSVIMDNTSSLAGGNEDWLLANINQTGYFIVNYDNENWNLLKTQLLVDHEVIPPTSRAALVNDIFTLARGDRSSTTNALDLSLYLRNEKEYVPWSAAFSAFSYVGEMLQSTGSHGMYQKFVVDLVTPYYSDVGWDDTNSDVAESLSRTLALNLACHHGHTECISTAIALFDQWMSNSSVNLISANIRSVVYCTAITHGSKEHWKFAWDQYKTTESGEQSLLMEALACTKLPWLLSRYLELSIQSNEIRRQDATNVISYIASNPYGESLAWDFFRANWDFYFETYGTNMFSFPTLVTGVTNPFSTPIRLQELEEFVENHPNLGTATKAFQQAIERIRSNIKWKELNVGNIEEWLQVQTKE
ncbi:aminopeptidase N-like [Glandiceps talaboti]